jgi:RimJ/RimL family protein N-acetyltransferase
VLPRRIDLGDGRALVLRHGSKDDVDALIALYRTLSDDDIYLRFFTGRRPDRRLFEHMVALEPDGGALLVVELEDPTAEGPTRIVADAWYSLLPNGNGELAITVEDAWRGWLGPLLLDALLDVAASRGVPNLEADVLLRNRAMLALARRRGCVRVGDDGSTVRVELPTRGELPTWPPGAAHPRVLVEGHTSWRAHDAARRAGMEVVVCPGPAARRRGCPLLEGGTCPLVEGADAIVVSLAARDTRLAELARRHSSQPPAVPVIVEVGAAAPPPEGVRVVRATEDEKAIVAAVRDALADAADRSRPPEAEDPT